MTIYSWLEIRTAMSWNDKMNKQKRSSMLVIKRICKLSRYTYRYIISSWIMPMKREGTRKKFESLSMKWPIESLQNIFYHKSMIRIIICIIHPMYIHNIYIYLYIIDIIYWFWYIMARSTSISLKLSWDFQRLVFSLSSIVWEPIKINKVSLCFCFFSFCFLYIVRLRSQVIHVHTRHLT